MVKVFVVYDSKYGNTKLVAQKIVEGMRMVEGTEVDLGYVKEVSPDTVVNYDVLLIGAPNHMGKPSRTAMKFLGELAKVSLGAKAVAAFDTYFEKPKNYGKAMRKLEKVIVEKFPSLRLLTPGLSVKVTGIRGPVADGELPKCVEFGKWVVNQVKA